MAITGDWTSAIVDGTTVDNQAFQQSSPRNSITGWVFGEDHHANATGTKVTSGGLATNAVASGNIQNGQVTSAKVATNAISSGKVQDGQITSGKCASAQVALLAGAQTIGGVKTFSSGVIGNPQVYTPAAAGTATVDLSKGNEHRITMPTGNITIAISNPTSGQKFIISTTQDATGSRTVTWFSTIKWAEGSAPTLTTTANKRDIFGFICQTSGNYDGGIVWQNI